MPDAVNIVTGNQTASAITPTADQTAEGASTNASGIQAVAGIGPMTFKSGIPQYRAKANQPMQTPATRATATPRAYPPSSRMSECQVLSNSRWRSSTRLQSTVAGPGKYGSGRSRNPLVTNSQTQSERTAAAKMGHMRAIHRRSCAQKG